MATSEVQRFHAGEVFVTDKFCIILDCRSCDEQFGVYSKYLDHIFGKHFEDWTATSKNCNDTHNKRTNAKVPDEHPTKFHAGEVFVTKNLCILLVCKSCDEKFCVYTKFLDHIFGKHFEKWMASEKNENAKPESEINIPLNDLSASEELYVDIESTNDKEIPNSIDLITDILQPMENEAFLMNKDENEYERNLLPEATIKNVRPVRVFVTKSKKNEKEKKFKCKICGLAFAEIHNMRGHEQRHSNVRPFSCLECNKGFYTSTELKYHTRRHNRDLPCVCTYCGRGFVNISLLRTHEKRHTGDRSHKCDQCDKSFYDSYQLKLHYVVHTQERNYSCEKCHARFGRRKTLKTHMKLHENALRYECMVCHLRFNQRPSLLWHIKSKHGTIHDDDNSIEANNPIAVVYYVT